MARMGSQDSRRGSPVTKNFADWRLILDGRERHGKLTLGDISSTTQCSCLDRGQWTSEYMTILIDYTCCAVPFE